MRIGRDDREDKYTMVLGEGTTQLEETAKEKDLGRCAYIDNKLDQVLRPHQPALVLPVVGS